MFELKSDLSGGLETAEEEDFGPGKFAKHQKVRLFTCKHFLEFINFYVDFLTFRYVYCKIMENELLVNRSWEIQISHSGKWVKTQGADLATLLRLEVVCFYHL